MRYLHGDELLAVDTLRALEVRCRRAWELRERLLLTGKMLEREVEEMARRDLLDVAVLWAECHVRLAAVAEVDEAWREGLFILNEAESPNSVAVRS